MDGKRRTPVWVLVTAGAVLATAGGGFYVLSRDVSRVVPAAAPIYRPLVPDVFVSKAERLPAASDSAEIKCSTFSPDGKLLAAGRTDGKVDLWDVFTRTRVRQLEAGTFPIRALAFSPDGRLLAGSGFGPVLYTWETQSGELFARIEDSAAGGSFGILFIPEGLLAAARGDGSLMLWDVQEEERAGYIEGEHDEAATALAISPDGNLLAGRSQDGHVQVWDLRRRQAVANYDLGEPRGRRLPDLGTHSIAFSPNGPSTVLTSTEQSVWEVGPKGQKEMPITGVGQVQGVATDATGETLLVYGYHSFTLRGPHGEELTEEAVIELNYTADEAALSPDGRTVAVVGFSAIQLFRVEDHRPKRRAATRRAPTISAAR